MKNLYCDESGFTGNNLSSDTQPIFTYSSVLINDDADAKSFIAECIEKYHIQGKEIKAGNIIRSHPNAVIDILKRYSERSLISVVDKKFALAGKFFEYIFEPVIAEKSSIFYGIEFHFFITNALYYCFKSKLTAAEQILTDFEQAIRDQDIGKLRIVFSSDENDSAMSKFLDDIYTFVQCHLDIIHAEFDAIRIEDGTSWILELSATALHGLLIEWGSDDSPLNVFCDKSQPLAAQMDFFNTMIGRTDHGYMHLGGQEQRITYNLAQPISLVNSRDFVGIQIADVFARSIAYALLNPEQSFSQDCLDICRSSIASNSIFPVPSYLDTNQQLTQIHIILLHELVERSRNKRDILKDINQTIASIKSWVQYQNLF